MKDLIKAILVGMVVAQSVSALEFKKHVVVETGNGTTITWEGETVEK